MEKLKSKFKVTLSLKTLEKMTSKKVEAIILNLIKNSFEKGRIKAE